MEKNNELKNDGFWGRACSRLSQQLQTAKEENEKLKQINNILPKKIEELSIELGNKTELLRQTKEENEKLNFQIERIYKYEIRSLKGQVYQLDKERKCLHQAWIKGFNENKNLTQQNKQNLS